MNDVAMENANLAGEEKINFTLVGGVANKTKKKINWMFWGVMTVITGAVISAGYYVYFYVLYPEPWYESIWKSIFG